jgi:hypothetical protein
VRHRPRDTFRFGRLSMAWWKRALPVSLTPPFVAPQTLRYLNFPQQVKPR